MALDAFLHVRSEGLAGKGMYLDAHRGLGIYASREPTLSQIREAV